MPFFDTHGGIKGVNKMGIPSTHMYNAVRNSGPVLLAGISFFHSGSTGSGMDVSMPLFWDDKSPVVAGL